MAAISTGAPADVNTVEEIPIDALAVSEKNVRHDVAASDDTSVDDLAADIAIHGLLHPLTVRPLGGGYEIIAGQRRFMALQRLGRATAPCRVTELEDLAAEEISLTENTQRAQLSSGDKVRTYSRLYEIYNRDMARLARAVSVTPATLRKYIKIAALPEDVLTRLDAKGDGRITVDTATVLAKVPAEQVAMVADAIVVLSTNSERAGAAKAIMSAIDEDGADVDADTMAQIVDDWRVQDLEEKGRLAPTEPWVFGPEGQYVVIPCDLHGDVYDLVVAATARQ
jgi:ParB/RepB/Spo0J family partition protein